MNTGFVDGLRIARRLGEVKVLAYWNWSFRKATRRGRLGSAAVLLGAATFLVLVLWTPQVGGLVVLSHRRLGGQDEAALRGTVGLGLLGYTVMVLYGSLLFSISALLLDRDLEMLLVAPYSVAAVLGAKIWVRVGSLFAIILAVLLPVVVGLPLVTGKPLAAIIAVVILVATPMLPVALMSALMMSVIRFVPPNRAREVVALLSLGLAAALEIANLGFGGSPGPRLVSRLSRSPLASPAWLPHGWASRAVADALFGRQTSAIAWALLALAVGIAAVWASVQVSARVYVTGWSDYAPRRPARRRLSAEPAIARPTGATRPPLLARLGLNSAASAVWTKDWRTRRRDLVMLVRMTLPVLALSLFAFRGGGALGGFTHIRGGPLAASIALVPIPLVTLGLATALGLTSLSLEGGAIWMYAVSPNGMSRMLLGKVLVAAPPVALAAVAAAAFTEFAVHPGVGWAIPAVLLAAIFGASLAIVMVAVGGLFPRFTWTDPRRMVSPLSAWVGLAMQLVMIFVVTLLMTLGLVLGRLGVVPPLAGFAGGLLLAAAACVGIALATVATAHARLSRIEFGLGLAEQSLS
ncbi:MAG: putative ABC transporter permease subunit [Candidatus Dormibacteria bacterium]